MGAVIGAGAGLLSSALGSIFAKPQVQTTDSTSNQTIQGNQNLYGKTANTIDYDTGSANLRNLLTNLYSQNLMQPYDVQGQINTGLQGNNAASAGRTLNLNQILAARGLSSSPVATNALVNEQGTRASLNAQTINSAPQLMQQMFLQRMGAAGGFFNGLQQNTTGQTSQTGDSYQTGTTTGHSTTTGSVNPVGNTLSGLGTTLAGLAGQGFFGKVPGR
jgi:hypothetical protein